MSHFAASHAACTDILKIVNGQTDVDTLNANLVCPATERTKQFSSNTQLRVTDPKIKQQIEFPCADASSDLCNWLEAITLLFITRAHAVEKIDIDFSLCGHQSAQSQHTSKAHSICVLALFFFFVVFVGVSVHWTRPRAREPFTYWHWLSRTVRPRGDECQCQVCLAIVMQWETMTIQLKNFIRPIELTHSRSGRARSSNTHLVKYALCR